MMLYDKITGIYKIEYAFDGNSAVLRCSFDVKQNNTSTNVTGHFFNVTNIEISSMGSYIPISGFDIIDHKQDGWMPENRFQVYDYEDDSISFYCESFYFEKETEG